MTDSRTTALAIVPKTLDETADLAERFSKSSLLPKGMQGKSADVMVTIMAGAEMGLAPMASLRAIHVIEGRPVLSADGMVAVIHGSGKCEYFERVAESDTSVTYETKRVGAKSPRTCTWTLQMAKTAGLHLKDNWRAYPRAMLASRAKSELARDVYPDVLAGCYTDDEIERTPNTAPSRPTPPPAKDEIPDAEIVTETSGGEPPELAAIDSAETEAALQALAPALGKLTNGWKKIAKERYAARLKKLRTQSQPLPVVETTATEVAPVEAAS